MRVAVPVFLSAVALLVAAPTAGASTLVTLDVPSKASNVAAPQFAPSLKVNVLLPDRYDKRKAYPLLYLMHGAGEHFSSWADPKRGDVANTLKGLDAIVVMPEGGLGFYSNWWNDGARQSPAWERYHLDEVIPFVEKRYRIRKERRYHAIAGFSMAGFGSSFFAAERPGYFGTAVPMSGLVAINRPEVEQGLSAISGVDYAKLWGPRDAFYVLGHDPISRARNLQYSHVILRTGNGIPRPGVPFVADSAAVSGPLETVLKLQNDDFAAALQRAGADVNYRVHDGVHDWPYWREDIAEAKQIGLFRPVTEQPAAWSYATVAQTGDAWGVKFRFAKPPAQVVKLIRSGSKLRGDGAGTVTLTDARGCTRKLKLPFVTSFRCTKK